MPGSMMTGTAPSLNRANTEAIRGSPGLTMTSARSPRATPFALSLAHHASVSPRSPEKLRER